MSGLGQKVENGRRKTISRMGHLRNVLGHLMATVSQHQDQNLVFLWTLFHEYHRHGEEPVHCGLSFAEVSYQQINPSVRRLRLPVLWLLLHSLPIQIQARSRLQSAMIMASMIIMTLLRQQHPLCQTLWRMTQGIFILILILVNLL